MDRRGNRPNALAPVAALALALVAGACGEQPSPRATETSAASPATSAPSEDAAAMAAAEATVRAYFSVKGRAEDRVSVLVAKQAAYVTSRDVNPTRAYDKKMSRLPSGITDIDKSVELSNTRMVDDEILVDFAAEWTSVTYMFINDVMQLDRGQPAGGYWDGTATLEDRDGTWLINDFTTERYGGNLS